MNTDYVHRLESEEEGTFNASHEGHVRYTNLSTRGQQVVDHTIDRGKHVVETEDQTVSAFMYPTDYNNLGSGWYVVRHDGRNYLLATNKRTPGLSGVFLTPFVGIAGLVGFLLCARSLFTLYLRSMTID
ncbi:hypothetical protein ACFR9U_06585 [Halorientalis brevis]|uniref:DUF7979 domain-containing protein n=1 Tax=Halorientalis brevis TaxID=1126241 RepID=A0ABD6CB69_9EURY|nr:hypothetical protein [Halorientalis brevis]